MEDKAENQRILQDTIRRFEEKHAVAMANSEKLKDILLKELLIKDTIIINNQGMKDKYYRLAQELNFKLKIPRHHLEFLHQKGSLDHFVSCKISGDDMESKWALLKSGEKEI